MGASHSSSNPEPALPTTKEALGEHLFAKVKPLHPAHAERITGMLLECQHEEVVKMLKEEQFLKKRIEKACQAITQGNGTCEMPIPKEKEEIGEQLFAKVAEIESELCAQVTGMLLELDLDILQKLVKNPSELEAAVDRARKEYLKQIAEEEEESDEESEMDSEREELGEQIFEIVDQKFPEHSGKVTGMMLEMSPEKLRVLLENRPELDKKIEKAVEALKTGQTDS